MSIFTRYGAKRLLKLADILAVADKAHVKVGEPTYDQARYVHPCGTPACALGHYAKATPARFQIDESRYAIRTHDGKAVFDDSKATLDEFGIDRFEAHLLFSGAGCGGADTGKQAAAYIRKFVKNKLKEESHV